MGRHRRTRRNKKQRRIIVVSLISFLFIMIGGYAAFQTNLNITAKGNIMCNGTIVKDLLLKNVVDVGDGLYKDEYEDGKYTYKGANPNNYITFSGEMWRIISVESDGTLKITRNESIGNRAWDDTNSNDWTRPATLNTYLNEEYLQTLLDFDKVITHTWSTGAVELVNDDLADQISDENGTTWNGHVGLITASEYLRANSNNEQCGNFKLANENAQLCLTTNWIYSIGPANDYVWTLSPYNGNSITVFRISHWGNLNVNNQVTYLSYVVPTLYLTSSLKLCGQGTKENPYVIVN